MKLPEFYREGMIISNFYEHGATLKDIASNFDMDESDLSDLRESMTEGFQNSYTYLTFLNKLLATQKEMHDAISKLVAMQAEEYFNPLDFREIANSLYVYNIGLSKLFESLDLANFNRAISETEYLSDEITKCYRVIAALQKNYMALKNDQAIPHPEYVDNENIIKPYEINCLEIDTERRRVVLENHDLFDLLHKYQKNLNALRRRQPEPHPECDDEFEALLNPTMDDEDIDFEQFDDDTDNLEEIYNEVLSDLEREISGKQSERKAISHN